MTALFYAHSGLRYLVLLAALIAIVHAGYALATRRAIDRPARIVGTAFVGLLDLQILLGLLLMMAGVYYGALIGHLAMMLSAALVAHAASAYSRRIEEPKRFYGVRLAGFVVSLALIAMGIAAIGRSLFASGAPSVG